MAQYDITFEVSTHLDRHLIFPLLEFLSQQKLYPDEEIQRGKIDLLQKTNMVDYAMDIYKQLNNESEAPAYMLDRRQEVVGRLKSLKAQADKIAKLVLDKNFQMQLKPDKAYNLQLLRTEYALGPEDIEALYHYAKFQYECGSYTTASELLTQYRILCTSSDRNMSALWGKFAADILDEEWTTAIDDMNKLRELIDANTFAPVLTQIQQRVWLMHWGLYIFFNVDSGRNTIVELFMSDKYLLALQTSAQHLLRYLAVAVLINRRRRNVLKDLIRVVQQEAYEYQDPITEFLIKLFVECDFDGAQEKLIECEKLLSADFFLANVKNEFLDAARLHIFETYVRVHKCIDLGLLADKLNMNRDEAEKWIVNLIRSSNISAKIDSSAGTVVMGQSQLSPYDHLLDRTKALSFKTFQLANQVVQAAAQQTAPPTAAAAR